MCGIAGFVGGGTRENLEKMTRTLQYRGPDGEGYFFDAALGVGLGHRRLSIIDLGGGKQPIFNEDKTVALVFNGEIYNFLELRKDLENRHKFLTESDTEVIVHLYEELGEQVFEKLNGMFAIALYDIKKQKLILARDRLGKKPLYWAQFGNSIFFGSEIKALMRHPNFKKEINYSSLNKYLSYDYVPTPLSIWKNVQKLEPASYLVWEKEKIVKGVFWKTSFGAWDGSGAHALGHLDNLLNESVKMRLISDVPLGIFLSGGLDSSAIAYYAQKNSSVPVKTFSIAFEEKSFDESAYARQAAKFLGAEHFEKRFFAKDLLNLVPRIAELLDEPLADASILPTYLLSQFTREKVTVALSGDGGDELFAGYPTFQADKLASLYEKIPAVFRKIILEKIIRSLPVGHSNFSLDFKLKKFLDGFGDLPKYRHQRWLGSFLKEEKGKLFNSEIWQEVKNQNEFEEADHYRSEVKADTKQNALIYEYMRTYLMDEVLVKVDRASMFNSLEVRAPFLDYQLVDFVNSLPYNFKNRGWQTKYLLKRLMSSKLPKDIVFRPKKGFGVPLGEWLRKDLKDFCNQLLSKEEFSKSGFFNISCIEQLKNEHFSGKKDNRKLLWNLMVFQLWQNNWNKN